MHHSSFPAAVDLLRQIQLASTGEGENQILSNMVRQNCNRCRILAADFHGLPEYAHVRWTNFLEDLCDQHAACVSLATASPSNSLEILVWAISEHRLKVLNCEVASSVLFNKVASRAVSKDLSAKEKIFVLELLKLLVSSDECKGLVGNLTARICWL